MNVLLSALPAVARAVVPSVIGAVARGASQREVISLIRSAGLRYSSGGPWGMILRYAREAQTYSDNVRRVSGNRSPNISRLPISVGETRRRFSWTVRLDLRDDEGSKYETFVTVSTDNPSLTINQIKDAAMKHGQEYDFGIGGEVFGAVVVGGTQRASYNALK